MNLALYCELIAWYYLLDPTEDHAEETASYAAGFGAAIKGPRKTLLELGSGAGSNAYFLKKHFTCTLTDRSDPMLGLSRALNPDCEHLSGDMRSLRLDRTFDAVLVHDAVVYMTSVADLKAAMATAFLHTRPGGVAIFAPDCLRETFRENTDLIEGDDGQRSLRCLEWVWDPDPDDDTFMAEYAFLLREGSSVRAVHDRHLEGLFARAAWISMLKEAGFGVELIDRPIGGGENDQVFLCRRALS